MSIFQTRLTSFRKLLAHHNLDGYVQYRSDVHQGEYVASSEERLHFLTGFSGSAGATIILMDKAAVFADGRYTVQVPQQVDLTLFEHQHLAENPPQSWLSKNVKKGQKIGFNPWLSTSRQVEALRKDLESTGVELVPVANDLVDEIWEDRPAPPSSEVWDYPLELAGLTFIQKRDKVIKTLKEKGADITALTLPDSVAWLLNIRGHDIPCNPFILSFVLIHQSGKVQWFVDASKFPKTPLVINEQPVEILPVSQFAQAYTQGVTNKAVLLDKVWSPYELTRLAQENNATVIYGSDPTMLPKALKTPQEQEAMTVANNRDSIAWVRFLTWLDEMALPRIQAGNPLTEIECSDKILEFRKDLDKFLEPSFHTISASGPNGAMCHYCASEESNAKLVKDSLYLIDSGGQYLEGTTDSTRTIPIGTPTSDMKTDFTRVLKGHITLALAHFPKGTQGFALDALARMHLWSVGKDYDHGTGHGVGICLCVHEGPQRIGKVPQTEGLANGMTITNEPGYYRAGHYGIRIENLCLVVEDDYGFLRLEDLTLIPIDKRLIDLNLMEKAELNWLNNYHKKVFDKIAPHVNEKERVWLEKATAPIIIE